MQDAFGREITYLRLSVTELCNLRCRYCMPEEGICKRPHEEMLTEEEMILAVKTVSELGVRKLRITGGEPLVKKNILSICEKAAALPGIEEVCITTNGTLLPGLAVPLRRAGVGRLNISLDTLDADKYRKITRVGRLDDALSGIEAVLAAGFEKIKINTVLIGGFNDDEASELCRLTRILHAGLMEATHRRLLITQLLLQEPLEDQGRSRAAWVASRVSREERGRV